ncbi:hypothetical protein [Planktothrix sp.]|uniref:hypothetical protein n=2 Tax=Planktothrix sp. TaxID=3088171 RepID=UPI0038D4D072
MTERKKAQCVKTTSYNCGRSCINVMKTCRVVPKDAKSKDRLQKLKAMGIDYVKIKPLKSKVKPTPTPKPTPKPTPEPTPIPVPVKPIQVTPIQVTPIPVAVPEPDIVEVVKDFTGKVKPGVKETPEQRKARLLGEAKKRRQNLLEMYDDFMSGYERYGSKKDVLSNSLDTANPEKYINKQINDTRQKIFALTRTNPSQAEALSQGIENDLEPALMELSNFMAEARKFLLEVDNPTPLKVKIKEENDSVLYQHLYKKGIDILSKMVDLPKLKSSVTLATAKTLGTRSGYNSNSLTITMATDDPGTLIHEMGHWIESSVSGIANEAKRFYNSRTEGEKTVKLKTFDPTYGNDEITKVDQWINPYMGKVYSDGSTEIISMGLELMYRNPVYLAKKDPEMFDFIYSVVRRG